MLIVLLLATGCGGGGGSPPTGPGQVAVVQDQQRLLAVPDGDRTLVSEVPLAEGRNELRVETKDATGRLVTTTVVVTGAPSSHVAELTVAPDCATGLPTQIALHSAIAPAPDPVTADLLDHDRNGIFTSSVPSFPTTLDYSTAGQFWPRALALNSMAFPRADAHTALGTDPRGSSEVGAEGAADLDGAGGGRWLWGGGRHGNERENLEGPATSATRRALSLPGRHASQTRGSRTFAHYPRWAAETGGVKMVANALSSHCEAYPRRGPQQPMAQHQSNPDGVRDIGQAGSMCPRWDRAFGVPRGRGEASTCSSLRSSVVLGFGVGLLLLVSVAASQGSPQEGSLMAHDGRLVSAEHGGGAEVVANRTDIGPWEVFRFWDSNAGDFRSGDVVFPQAWNLNFWAAEGGGGPGSVVNANRGYWSFGWERFDVLKQDFANGNLLRSGDSVALRAFSGSYVSAGSFTPNNRLVADRSVVGDWEKFTWIPRVSPGAMRQINMEALDPSWVPLNYSNFIRHASQYLLGARTFRYQMIDRPSGNSRPNHQYRELIQAHIAQLDAMMPVLRALGISLILDLHSPPGLPAGPGLFLDRAAQLEFIAAWQMLASRYASDPVVVGFDICNEPRDEVLGPNCRPWSVLARDAIAAIRSIDTAARVSVYVETRAGNIAFLQSLSGLAGTPNIVVSVHTYAPRAFSLQGTPEFPNAGVVYPGAGASYQRSYIANFAQQLAAFRSQTGISVHVGEFGVYLAADDNSAFQWLRDHIEEFERHGIPWALHDYDGYLGLPSPYPSFPSKRAHLIWNWFK